MEDKITATQLDAILNKLVEWNKVNGKKYLNLSEAKLYFPEFSDIDLLFRYLGEYNIEGHSIVDFIGSKTGMEIYINAFTKPFVNSGGFIKRYEESHIDVDKNNRKENLEIELMQLEIKNLKALPGQVKFNKVMAWISIIIAVISLAISYWSNKNI